MDRKERIFRTFEVGAVVASLVVSIVALSTAVREGKENSRLAAEALKVAQEANSIALGSTREYPIIEIEDCPGKIDFSTAPSVRKQPHFLVLVNKGRISLTGIHLTLTAREGFTYSLDNPNEDYMEAPSLRIPIDFEEQLMPGGEVHVDLRSAVFKYLRSLNLSFSYRSRGYRSVVDILVVPKSIENPLPIRPPGYVTKDTETISIDFVPELLSSAELTGIDTLERALHVVYPPPN